eukprot:SAG22_NODE_901_length_6600_cov_1.945854_9_plen_187_part_00
MLMGLMGVAAAVFVGPCSCECINYCEDVHCECPRQTNLRKYLWDRCLRKTRVVALASSPVTVHEDLTWTKNCETLPRPQLSPAHASDSVALSAHKPVFCAEGVLRGEEICHQVLDTMSCTPLESSRMRCHVVGHHDGSPTRPLETGSDSELIVVQAREMPTMLSEIDSLNNVRIEIVPGVRPHTNP